MARGGGPAVWAFAGLDAAGAGARPLGPAATPAGGIALARGDTAVRQSILMLLCTVPGERVMRPDYGCPLHRLVFEPTNDTTAGLAIHYVRQALARFEPRVEVLRVAAAAEAEGGGAPRLVVRVDYRVRATLRADSVAVAVEGAG